MAEDQNTRIDRASFLYMEHGKDSYGDPHDFAQCKSCCLWTGEERKRCFILGKKFEVVGEATCALYANGKPQIELLSGNEIEAVTPREAGFENRAVRCENCVYFNPTISGCKLFAVLDIEFPEDSNLGWKVKGVGCCNANLPIEEGKHKKKDLILRFLNKEFTLQQLLNDKRIKEFKGKE